MMLPRVGYQPQMLNRLDVLHFVGATRVVNLRAQCATNRSSCASHQTRLRLWRFPLLTGSVKQRKAPQTALFEPPTPTVVNT